jgi:hypothetical protein
MLDRAALDGRTRVAGTQASPRLRLIHAGSIFQILRLDGTYCHISYLIFSHKITQ